MKNRAIVFNGPPNSGKDFAADYITTLAGEKGFHKRFKDKLYELTKLIYSVHSDEIFYRLMTDRSLKDRPSQYFDGKTPRQALIYVSEEVIKPSFGDDYFGVSLTLDIENIEQTMRCDGLTFCVSDSGFVEELRPLAYSLPVTFIRLHREGCDFSNDSRTYIDPYKHNINVVEVIDLVNDGSDNFKLHLEEIFNRGIR